MKRIRYVLILFVVILLGGCFDTTTKKTTNTTAKTTVVEETGKLELNKNNTVSYSSDSYNVLNGNYNYEYSNTSSYSNGYITINRGGYILNIDSYSDIDSFTVNYIVDTKNDNIEEMTGFGELYYTTDNYKIDNPFSYKRKKVNNNTLTTLSDDPKYIAFYSFNKIDIISIEINYKYDEIDEITDDSFKINLITTNDIHGQVDSDYTNNKIGIVEASGYINELKSSNKYNILLDSGDIYQGSIASHETNGRLMDDYLLLNGYDTTILGNHEWDWGEENILFHRNYSKTTMLCGNLEYNDDYQDVTLEGKSPTYSNLSKIIERGGCKIGVIGVIGKIESDISGSKILGITFIGSKTNSNNKNLTTIIKDEATKLKAEGCSYIILQIHNGNDYDNKTTSDIEEISFSSLKGDIDLSVEGHSHQSYFFKENEIYHVQNYGYFKSFTSLKLNVSLVDGEYNVSLDESSYKSIGYSQVNNKSDSLMLEIKNWYKENVYDEVANKTCGTIPVSYSSEQLDDLCAEAYYELVYMYPNEFESISVSYSGGNIKCRDPKKLDANVLTTYEMIANLYPFDNDMYLLKVSKGVLKEYFMINSYDYTTYGGITKSNLTQSYYYIITDSFTYDNIVYSKNLSYGIEIITNFTAKYGVYPRDMMFEHLNYLYNDNSRDDTTVYDQTISVNSLTITVDYQTLNEDSSTIKYTINNLDLVRVIGTGVSAVSNYEEIKVPSNKYITIEALGNYTIDSIYVKIYKTTDLANFYQTDTVIYNESFTKETNYAYYNIDVDNNKVIIKNVNSSYTMYIYNINIVLKSK